MTENQTKVRKEMNWFIALPVILVIFFTMAAFAGSRVRPTSSRPSNTLIIAQSSDPLFLNPVLASDAVSMYVNAFIFNTLVKYNEKMEIAPDLAESWEIKDEGRKIIFHLRKDVRWHDGREFTAEDCVFTFRRVVDPNTNSFNAGLFKVNDKDIIFTAPDKYTLVADLPTAFAPFLNNLTLIGIIPKHIFENENINTSGFSRNPVGTGPFRFVEWQASDSLTLERFPDYFRGEPKLEKVVFKIIPSAEGRRIALLSEQVDVAGLTAEDVLLLKNKLPSQIHILKWEEFMYFYFSMDLTNEMFMDKRVRQAFNHAVDTTVITNAALHGAGSPIYGPIPRASWAYAGDVNRFPHDPEKARQLLEDAGWKMEKDKFRYKNGKKFSFTLAFRSGSQASEAACLFIQSYLRDVGVEVKLQQLDLGALIRILTPPNRYESVVFDWVETSDPDFFTEWHSSQMGLVGMNFMSYSNKEVDTLIEQARSTFDINERKRLYIRIQELIAEDAPYIFLWNEEAHLGVNDRVKGLPSPSPAGPWIYPDTVWLEGK